MTPLLLYPDPDSCSDYPDFISFLCEDAGGAANQLGMETLPFVYRDYTTAHDMTEDHIFFFRQNTRSEF